MSETRTAAAIAAHFTGPEWDDVRPAVVAAAAAGVSPTQLGLATEVYRRAKAGLRAVADAMAADGLFPPPLFTTTEVECVLARQAKLADLAAARGLRDDDPVAPELPPAVTVAALRARAFPTLRHPLAAAWRRLGGRIDGSGCWVQPKANLRKVLEGEK